MENKKILNLLNKVSDSKFVTRRWDIANDQSNANYDVGDEIIYNTKVLKSNLCDYNSAYILVRVNLIIIGHAATQVAFSNYAPFTNCTTKFIVTAIEDAEELDLAISMCNWLEYSSNYTDTKGSVWFYSEVEGTNFNADIGNNNFRSFFLWG